MASKKDAGGKQEFIERLGQITQEAGLTRIAGQIWAALVVSDGPVSAAELVEILRISKGSLCTNVRILELMGIVERRSVPGERQDYFAIQDNPYAALVELQIKRFEKAISVVSEARSSIRGRHASKKLADLELFYSLYRSSSMDLLRAMEAQKK
ncbi:MAG TPA: hypothetical protein PKH39_04140 [Woeseiaceae bacterium]|nr:hypothetical protein [Woeseiaceae bacterium]